MRRRLKTLHSTQSVCPVRDVREDIVLLDDGRYVKLMEFSPINFELRSADEQDMIISRFGSALRTWPQQVHIKVITTPADITAFTRELEEHRAQEPGERCRALQSDQIEMLQRISDAQGVTRRFFVSFEYEEGNGLKRTPKFAEVRNSLERQSRSVRASLEACGNAQLSIPERDYTLSALYAAMCRSRSERESWEEHRERIVGRYRRQYGASFPEEQIPVADLICPESMDTAFSPRYVRIDGKYLTYCYLPSDSYPVQAGGGWLQILFNYMDGVDVDFWIERKDPETVQRSLSLQLKNNVIRQRNTDRISMDYEDITAAVESGYYIQQALASGEDFCYMSAMITISADSPEELAVRVREMREYCIRNELRLRVCTFQQEEACRAAIPVSPYHRGIFRKSRRNIMTSQLGSCYPFTAYELCDRHGIFLGINSRYGSPVFINPFLTAQYQNANMLVIGPSGSGKTYTLLCMLLRMRQKGLQVFVIAPLKGFEFYRAASAVDGEIVVLAPGSRQNINVMEIRKKDLRESQLLDGVSGREEGSILMNKIQQLLRFFTLILPDLAPSELLILDRCLVQTYAAFGITSKNKSLYDPYRPGEYKEMPLLEDLHRELKNAGEEASRMHALLERFVTGSASSFNQRTNVDLDNKFVVCDCSKLTPELLPAGMFICLDYIMDKAMASRTEKKVIAVDEMWKLMTASEQSAEFVMEVFRTIRGYAGAAIGATQNIDDVIGDRTGAAVFTNSKIKLLLSMTRKEADAVAKVMDLTQVESENLRRSEHTADANGKRLPSKALMVANTNHVFINIQASPMEHDLITTSAEDLSRIIKQKGGIRE